ncbi:MAG: hypothetical protein ACRD01_06830 [Terriglobales bacterium]
MKLPRAGRIGLGLAGLLLMASPMGMGAQQGTRASWEAVQALPAGEAVEVIQTDLQVERGRFRSASSDQLTLDLDVGERTLPRSSIARVSVRRSHRWQNVLLGAASGAGGGVVLGTLLHSGSGGFDAADSYGIAIPAGALLGAGVGALLPAGADWRDIYRSSPSLAGAGLSARSTETLAPPRVPLARALPAASDGGWAQLSGLLRGQTIEVVEMNMSTDRGRFERTDETQLVLTQSGASLSVPRVRVVRVSVRGSHRVRNATFAAAGAAGAGAAIEAAIAGSTNDGQDYAVAAVIFGLIGAAAGAAVPSSTWHEVYRARPANLPPARRQPR